MMSIEELQHAGTVVAWLWLLGAEKVQLYPLPLEHPRTAAPVPTLWMTALELRNIGYQTCLVKGLHQHLGAACMVIIAMADNKEIELGHAFGAKERHYHPLCVTETLAKSRTCIIEQCIRPLLYHHSQPLAYIQHMHLPALGFEQAKP